MKMLKAIRFDDSDTQVFELAAEPGELIVSGGFAFAEAGPDQLQGKTRQAFANGLLGLDSFGRTTFAQVASCPKSAREDAIAALAGHFRDVYGAPDEAVARAVAADEVDFVIELCSGKPVGTVFAVTRELVEGGGIREQFRDIDTASAKPHARIWDVVDDE